MAGRRCGRRGGACGCFAAAPARQNGAVAIERERQVGTPQGNIVLDLFVLHQRVGELMEVALEGTEVRPAEYAVYSQLAGGAMTPRDLSARLGVTPSTLTGQLEVLFRRGHISRERDPGDGRSYRVRLTDPGRQTLRQSRVGFRRVLRRYIAALPVDERTVRDLLIVLDTTAAQVVDRLKPEARRR